MAGSRGKGEGSVTKLKGGQWRARIRHEGKDYTAQRKTRREATAALDDLKVKAFGYTEDNEPTVAEYIAEYVEERRDEVAPNTY